MPTDHPRVNDYDGIAEAYSAGNEANLVNAYYERKAADGIEAAGVGDFRPRRARITRS
jgi:hypothetical protein